MISFEIAPSQAVLQTSIQVNVNLLEIGFGRRPFITKEPLENVEVHLIRRSSVPDDYYPINHKTFDVIYEYVAPISSKLTDSKGIVRFERVSRDDYVVIAHYEGGHEVFSHLGQCVDDRDPDWRRGKPIVIHLLVMEKADRKKVPCKTTKRTGSDLLIIEPEYIEWDSKQELYPFVFESVGNWSVTTSVNPPEGFVADRQSLSAEVQSDMEAVQFTITNIGSRWEETGVTHRIRHKGKTEFIKSKIGIRLSRRLAKEKGLSIYGNTESPGPFRGGRKVGKKKE
jgi:hypothetical protein